MTSTPARRSRAQVARVMQRNVGELAASALDRMEREMPWFRDLDAEHRSWIGMVVQAGIDSFISWYRDPSVPPPLASEVFGTAPRSFAGVVTLQQTVAMIRVTIEIVEDTVVEYVGEVDAADVTAGVLRYGRELAFATADVYAHAAEMRGAWDARLEALVVDSVMRSEADESVRTRASALGWTEPGHVAVVVGRVPTGTRDQSRESIVDDVRRSARMAGLDALVAGQGDRLVVVLGGVGDPGKAVAAVEPYFGDGPVVIGPVVADLLHAQVSARAAVSGLAAAPGWPGAPRPASSDDLLPERALAGDAEAREQLVAEVFTPLRESGGATFETLEAFLDQGGSIEATARALFVHPNTVRYRLKRALDVTGLVPGDPRHGFTLRVALTLGLLSEGRAAVGPVL